MSEIQSTAISFVVLILLSNILKQRGVLKVEDKNFLGSILINICLPCVIINGFRGFQYDSSLFFAIFLCMGISIFALILGYAVTRKQGRDSKIVHMMTSCGYNIGIFTVPFVSSFLSPVAVVSTLMFDIGNAIFVFGLLAAVTSYVVDHDTRNPIPALLKKLFSTPPFIVYMIMLICIAGNITLPEGFYTFVELGASGTSFLAMVLIGIMIDIEIDRSERKEILSAIVLRYSVSAMSVLIIYMLPMYDMEVKKALMIAAVSPVSTASVVLAQKLNCKSTLIGAVSSLSIVISIVAIMSIVLFL